LWLHSLKVAQLLRSAVCLHTNQRSYLNHLVSRFSPFLQIKNSTFGNFLRRHVICIDLYCKFNLQNMVDYVFIYRHKFAGHLHNLCFLLAPVFLCRLQQHSERRAHSSALLTLFQFTFTRSCAYEWRTENVFAQSYVWDRLIRGFLLWNEASFTTFYSRVFLLGGNKSQLWYL